jgi:hypothetical protein
MNESVIPNWFMEAMIVLALAQTGLLLVACLLIRESAGNLNRKLHRIESHTRQRNGSNRRSELDLCASWVVHRIRGMLKS